MPVLPNPKHEIFAQELAKGKSADTASAIADLPLSPCHRMVRFYVYILVDSRNGQVFYVGKGKDRRAHAHLADWRNGKVGNVPKHERIEAIVMAGGSVRALCFADDLCEADALDTERWLIAAIGIKNLTNLSHGEQSEMSRAGLMARLQLKRTRPFCRWKERILRQLDPEISRECWEALYWDITGDLSYILALSQGKSPRKFAPMYRECD